MKVTKMITNPAVGAASWPRLVAVVVILGTLIGVGASCRRPSPPSPSPPGSQPISVDNLLADIELLDTINRLELNSEQLDRLIKIVTRMEGTCAQYDQRQEGLQRELQPFLAQQRALLIKDQPGSEPLQADLQRCQQEAEQLQVNRSSALRQTIPGLREVLTDSQLEIIAGADEAKVEARNILAWLRELPEGEFQEEGPANAEALAAPDLGLDAEALLNIFTTARNMPAAQYRPAQEELVSRLAPIFGATPQAADDLLLTLFTNPRLKGILLEKAAITRR